jgi:hypothetical protein
LRTRASRRLAPPFAQRAFELRDRVSERERFFISWRYYRDATQAWDKALELSRVWTTTYPREAFAFQQPWHRVRAAGRARQAAVAYREAIRLDPRFVPPYGNLIAVLVATESHGGGEGDHPPRRAPLGFNRPACRGCRFSSRFHES